MRIRNVYKTVIYSIEGTELDALELDKKIHSHVCTVKIKLKSGDG